MAKKPTVKRKPKVPKTLDLLDELIKDAVAVSNRPDFDKLRAIAKGNKFKIPDVPGVIVAAGNKPEDKSALSGHVPDHMLNRGVPKGIDEVETRENERIDRAIQARIIEDQRREIRELHQEIKLTHEIYARILDRFLMD